MTEGPEPRSDPQSTNSEPDSTGAMGACSSAVPSSHRRPLPTPPSARTHVRVRVCAACVHTRRA